MKNRNPILLAAGVALLIAGWMLSRNHSGVSEDRDRGGPLMPAVAADVNKITGFKLSEAGDKVIAEIRLDGEQWKVSSSHDYPADLGKVRKFLLALKDAEKREPKTSKAERYGDIGVQDLSEDGASGVLLSLEGIAEPNKLILGNFASGGGEYTYVRLVGEEQSWLASGNLVPERNAGNWLKRDILDVPSNRIVRAEITAPDGAVLAVDKQDEAAPNYSVEKVPKGRELSSESAGNVLASALGSLQLDDVLRASEAQPPEQGSFKIRYLTRDGLIISATTWEADGKHLANFAAEVDPDFLAAWSAGEQARLEAMPKPVAAADAADAGDEAPASADPAASEPAADQASATIEDPAVELARLTSERKTALDAEVAAINSTAEGWTFVIPSWKYANMAKTMEELLAPKGE